MARLAQWLRAFGHFWWDFLIGDTPEFAVATLLIIGLALLLDHDRVTAAILLPLLTAAFLLGSTYRGRRRTASTLETTEPTRPTPNAD
jgi:multisubunit Na+/H+ antiporter MnhC subunit